MGQLKPQQGAREIQPSERGIMSSAPHACALQYASMKCTGIRARVGRYATAGKAQVPAKRIFHVPHSTTRQRKDLHPKHKFAVCMSGLDVGLPPLPEPEVTDRTLHDWLASHTRVSHIHRLQENFCFGTTIFYEYASDYAISCENR